jgi:hypothetical protein
LNAFNRILGQFAQELQRSAVLTEPVEHKARVSDLHWACDFVGYNKSGLGHKGLLFENDRVAIILVKW